jgi:hypothetical protein
MARRLQFHYSDPDSDGENDLVNHLEGQEELDEHEDASSGSDHHGDLYEFASSEESDGEMGTGFDETESQTVDIEYDAGPRENFELVIRVGGGSQASEEVQDWGSENEAWNEEQQEESNEEIEPERMGEEEMLEDGEEDEEEAYSEEEALALDRPPLQVIVDNRSTFSIDEYESFHKHKIILPYPAPTSRNKHLFEECSICFSQLFKKHAASCYLECVHWYHFSCLRSWSENKKECPVCRKEFLNILTVSE